MNGRPLTMTRGSRRGLLRAALAAIGLTLAATAIAPPPAAAHHHHKRRRKRCRQSCQANHQTCARGCDILDGDSQAFCKQSCRVARSQCRSEC